MQARDGRSDALRDYGQAALARFAEGDALEVYRAARSAFEAAFPSWEAFFENMLVNHMFFARFPFQDRPDSLRTEKRTLDAVYALLRFTGVGSGVSGRDELIDVFHAVFRLIDYTDFDRYAGRLLESLGCDTPEREKNLLIL